MKSRNGFTIVEVITVVVIISILASITGYAFTRQQMDARDNSRSTKALIVASALEKYYEEAGEYPSPRALINDYNTGDAVSTLISVSKDNLVMPRSSAGITNSIRGALDSDDTLAYVASSTVGNDNCQTNSTGGCDQFALSYNKEADGTTVTIDSLNSVRSNENQTPLGAPSKPTIAAAQSGTSMVGTATAPACSIASATPKYSFQTKEASGEWSPWSEWQVGNTHNISGLTNNTSYSFQVKERCDIGTNIGDTSPVSDPASAIYYTPPTAPSTPAIGLSPAAGTIATSATGTASGGTCDYGTLQYAIDYRTNDGTWTAGAWGTGTTQTVNSNQGAKYGFRATGRCVNGTQTATSGTTSESTVVTGVTAPAAPTVSGTGPTWSWSPSSCSAGSSPYYHYQFSYWNGSGWVAGGAWTWTGATSVTNSAATSQGIQYGINVTQYCYSGYINSGDSGAASGGTFWVPVVHVQIRTVAVRLATNAGQAWPVILMKTYTGGSANNGVCASGTARQVDLYGNYSMATNNWQVDVNGWFNADASNVVRTFWNAGVAVGNYFELTGHARCINSSTQYALDSAGNHDTYSIVYDAGNLYNKGSGQYSISCEPTGSGGSYCSGGYNSTGTLTDSALTSCAIRAGGITTDTKKYTPKINLGSNGACWNA